MLNYNLCNIYIEFDLYKLYCSINYYCNYLLNMKKIVFVLFAIMAARFLFAQDSLAKISLEDLLKNQPKSYFKFQASYLSNAVYFGRKDTATTLPYFTPTLEYTHKSGIYGSASLSYLANSASTIDFWCLEAGYNFNDKAEKFLGTVYVNKPFYKETSANLRADVNWNVGSSLSYNFGIVNATVIGSLMLGDNSDKFVTFSLDHEFDIEKGNTVISVVPMLSMNWSSTGFYQSFKGRRQNPRTGLPVNARIEITSPNKFQLMNYEFTLPITAEINDKYGFFAYPTFAIPVNPVVTNIKATTLTPGGIPVTLFNRSTIEKISNTFFIEIGGYIKF